MRGERRVASRLDKSSERLSVNAHTLHDYVAQLLVLGRMKIGLLQRLPLPSAGDEIGWTNTNPTTDAKTIGVMETLEAWATSPPGSVFSSSPWWYSLVRRVVPSTLIKSRIREIVPTLGNGGV